MVLQNRDMTLMFPNEEIILVSASYVDMSKTRLCFQLAVRQTFRCDSFSFAGCQLKCLVLARRCRGQRTEGRSFTIRQCQHGDVGPSAFLYLEAVLMGRVD